MAHTPNHLTRRALVATGLAALAAPALALPFDNAWQEQTFPRRKANRFALGGDRVDVTSDQGVSLLLRPVSEAQWGTRRASWSWQVTESVPGTPIDRKGGDDRNFALYFLFFPAEEARRLQGASPRRVLGASSSRALVYSWGGPQGGPRRFANPYLGNRGATIVLRPAGTGRFSETVDLGADYARVYGTAPDALFGVGLSADSDDSTSRIVGNISRLRLSA